MSKSKIEWTDRTWNPVTGCTKVSAGCKNCYAERLYERFHGKGSFKNIICHEDRLDQPFKWKQPALVFVNSMSDLFHEDVPFKFIHKVLMVMWKCRGTHTFQILTKRPERLLQFEQWMVDNINALWFGFAENVWIGVSVEDQATADQRIPLLLKFPAMIRFLSCEPLLGEIDLVRNSTPAGPRWLDKIHWVITGGESGPHARPMHPDWARSLRDQCAAAAVPFFFKQWGEYRPGCVMGTNNKNWYLLNSDGTKYKGQSNHIQAVLITKEGKKASGNLLDGKQHLEYPKPTT